jgi:dinuclear metal center YbgI/SA1388 family protein
MVTVSDVYDYLDEIAPFNTQAANDNSGLIIGNFGNEVRKIIVCLDVTSAVTAEIGNRDLVISHHPLMYRPIQRICETDPICYLIQQGNSLISAHTNLDIAVGGDLMLEALGFPPSDEPVDVYGKITMLPEPIEAEDLARKCCEVFGCKVVRYAFGGGELRRIGVCTGSGGGLVEIAREKGCDALICGDLTHDKMVFAKNFGITLIDAGHFHTEQLFSRFLTDKLSAKFPQLHVAVSAMSKLELCGYVTRED